jgi:hypothetical protein
VIPPVGGGADTGQKPDVTMQVQEAAELPKELTREEKIEKMLI